MLNEKIIIYQHKELRTKFIRSYIELQGYERDI
nr:MAG TPA: hypothetical protein [Caudoviricetes sp.]